MSLLKRQREMGKAEKAARKRRKRHGIREVGLQEPTATVRLADLLSGRAPAETDGPGGSPEENTGAEDKE